MGKYTQIPQSTFSELQMDAGVLASKFDTETGALDRKDIVCATTGGITITCTPTFSDMGSDIDNCPNNTKELKHLDGWEVGMQTNALGTSAEAIKLSLGCADVTGGVIKPRASLEQNDYKDLWWIGDRADGGMVAVKMMNALSTGGFSLKTTKNGKGQLTLNITGHPSIDSIETVPMEFYSKAGN